MNIGLDSLGSVGWAVAAAAMLLFAAYGCGRLVVPARGRGFLWQVEREALRVAVGLNLLGFAGITLGMLRLLGGGRSLWLVGVLGLLSVVVLLRDGRSVRWRSIELPSRWIALSS